MSVFADRNTRILIQGITGTQAAFHVKRAMENGTQIIAGTSPNRGGTEHLGLPVYNNVKEAIAAAPIDASVLFVPARAVKSAAREAIESEIKLVVSIARGVPVHDMLEIKSMLSGSKTLMFGPNTPGIITPGEARLGLYPEDIHHKGCIGIVARDSTLSMEAVLQTNLAGLGQSTVVGLGDDMIVGTDYCAVLDAFMADPETKAILLIGKADNVYEQIAAEYYKNLARQKPIIAFIAGDSLPFGANMGYAVDIITHGFTTVQDKKSFMRECGITVVDRINKIHEVLKSMNLE